MENNNPRLASQEEWAAAYFDMVGKMEHFLVCIHDETSAQDPYANIVLRVRHLSTEALRVLFEAGQPKNRPIA